MSTTSQESGALKNYMMMGKSELIPVQRIAHVRGLYKKLGQSLGKHYSQDIRILSMCINMLLENKIFRDGSLATETPNSWNRAAGS